MKKILLVLLSINLTFCLVGTAQTSFCRTGSNDPDFLQTLPTTSLGNPGPYTVRVYLHFLHRTDGTGGVNFDDFGFALYRISSDLYPHNICISLKGFEDINNDTYYNGAMDIYQNAVQSTNNQSDAIDIYVYPDATPFEGGIASGIPGSAFSIGGIWDSTIVVMNSRIISHEMGHCLGLFHTHHQLDTGGSTPDCNNGTNCTTGGDYVCDTPPDPFLNWNPTCNYTGSATDACGALMNPNEHIIMSYTYPSCMQYFTNGEGQRMRDYIANNPILQAATVPDNVFVQNKNFVTAAPVLYAARTSVTAGENVTTGTQGAVSFSGVAVGEFKSHEYIKLEPGFIATPNSMGNFYAWIDPNFCDVVTTNNAKFAGNDPSGDNSSITVFPNPLRDKLGIELTGSSDRLVSVSITDITGKLIMFEDKISNALTQSFNTSKFVSGLYTIVITTTSSVYQKKIVVEK